MLKKILAVLAALLITVPVLSGCSSAEGIGNLIHKLTESAGDIIPNDIEYLFGTLSGDKEDTSDHQIIFSTGYVNMLKNGKYFIGYTADDGTEISYGTNGIRWGISYPIGGAAAEEPSSEEPSSEEASSGAAEESESSEAESEPEVPSINIVMEDGVCYLVDDDAGTLTTVNPADYKASPFVIDASDLAFKEAGDKELDGVSYHYEEYDGSAGSVTFYYSGSNLAAMEISETQTSILLHITKFNKWVSSELINLPTSYKVIR
ncbi:MAG TPA: hypothetical protein PLU75_09555 [Oscillospiraceae bacterium]|jgi:predicted small secreted protein|nr:hypothetical protein [Oscillospiraceae bacterium]HPD89695.1 hypothetical protein [Oscillospiraceae bacterium]HRW57315.1 hypothetical protein [Oscillospiraceae bacterium]